MSTGDPVSTEGPANADGPGRRSTLRVGILLCDHLDDEVAARHGDYEGRYRTLLGPLGVDAVVHDLTRGEAPASTAECDAWLVSGSRRSAYDDEAFVPALTRFVADAVEADVPVVGICFGHQVVARALGGRVERAEGWGIGVKRYHLGGGARTGAGPPPWMEGSPESFTMVVSHRDQVVELPDGAELLASAEYCPVAAFHVGDGVFCVQGHPEFDVALSATLSRRRRAAIGHDVVEAGLASLGTAPDNPLVAEWIQRFLRRRP